MITWGCKCKLEVTWKPGVLNFDVDTMRYTNGSISNLGGRCNNVPLDRTNQIRLSATQPETTGMEGGEQETKTGAVQNPEYQEKGSVLLTPQTNRKNKNQTFEKIKC